MRAECKAKPYEFQPLGNRAVVAVMRTLPPCRPRGRRYRSDTLPKPKTRPFGRLWRIDTVKDSQHCAAKVREVSF